MKKLYRISLLFVMAAAFFTGGVMTKVYLDGQPLFPDKADFYEQKGERTKNQELAETQEATRAVSTAVEKLSGETEYVVRSYDRNTGEATEALEKIPPKYIGFTRKQLEEELEQYTLSPSLSDLELGFVSAALESFSGEKIVVQKNYQPIVEEEVDPCFFLAATDNLVTVFQSDMKTIYMRTEITMDSLPEEIQSEILDMKYIENEEELYNFLESYSS